MKNLLGKVIYDYEYFISPTLAIASINIDLVSGIFFFMLLINNFIFIMYFFYKFYLLQLVSTLSLEIQEQGFVLISISLFRKQNVLTNFNVCFS